MGLGLVQPTHGQQQGRVLRRVQGSPVERRGLVGDGGEVRDAADPAGRPALADDPLGDVLGVGHQVVEAAVVLEIVVAAEAADPRPGALRRMSRRPVHPGERHLRVLGLREGRGLAPGQKIERTAERQRLHMDARRRQRRLAPGVRPDGAGLGDARALQRRDQVDEVGLGPAFARRPQEMKHAHRPRTLAARRRDPKPLEATKISAYNPRLSRDPWLGSSDG
ncbi:hypothetical protein LRS04_01660 [Phenylobacterium sp. J367]|nr:hypothetical protein [Phenylobacterium sp. J367]MCR5877223.1 hypothetical protein [Phenylobacterium sp. J367]